MKLLKESQEKSCRLFLKCLTINKKKEKEDTMYYIYILECADGTFYTGYTTQVEERVLAHNAKKGAKYTRGRTPVKLVYQESFEEKSEALKREYAIKKMTRKEKVKLMNTQYLK